LGLKIKFGGGEAEEGSWMKENGKESLLGFEFSCGGAQRL